MKLNLMERLMALQLLPAEGNFATLKSLRVARETLGLTEEEVKEFEFVQEESQAKWNKKGAEYRELELGDFAVEAVKSKLKKLDEENKLEERQLSIYEKFVEGKDGNN